MRVKLCGRCPYTPRDLAGHYDADAVLYACAKCDAIFDPHYSREAHRRRQWSPTHPTISMIPQGVAPFAKDVLVSSAITPGELPSVQRSASIASRPEGRATTAGCADSAPPDGGYRVATGISCGTAIGNREPAE
jgi:hypothetical protein